KRTPCSRCVCARVRQITTFGDRRFITSGWVLPGFVTSLTAGCGPTRRIHQESRRNSHVVLSVLAGFAAAWRWCCSCRSWCRGVLSGRAAGGREGWARRELVERRFSERLGSSWRSRRYSRFRIRAGRRTTAPTIHRDILPAIRPAPRLARRAPPPLALSARPV